MITCDLCKAEMAHRDDSFSIDVDGFRQICATCFKPMDEAVKKREQEDWNKREKMWLQMALDKKNELREKTSE